MFLFQRLILNILIIGKNVALFILEFVHYFTNMRLLISRTHGQSFKEKIILEEILHFLLKDIRHFKQK